MRLFKKMMLGLMWLVVALALGIWAYLQHPKFGKLPEGERLAVLERSPHYAEGVFSNLVATPMFADDRNFMSVLLSNVSNRASNLRPNIALPAIKTDLKALDARRDTMVWLGHSSFFVVFAGKRILIDPVFSPYAAPVSFSTRAFEGTSIYTADDMPEIDVLLITHDHWDHLDYASVTALMPKVKRVFVPLGVGAYLEYWGYAKDKIAEADWYDKLELEHGVAIHAIPSRHYSGRTLNRNRTLWAGFVLESATRRILFGSDSGYGPHYAELGQRFGSFDLVALDMGQYDANWPYIHMTPEEASQAAVDLNARTLLPAHIGRFSIANHAWDEPFERIVAASGGKPYRLATPRIGEPVMLDQKEQQFSSWWSEVL
ncbi:MAG: MBL fold metallo-hydrolase [Sideroxydans sp.]|nr:MBL fold metallo-hydrolase [Sideroxydans sp.]